MISWFGGFENYVRPQRHLAPKPRLPSTLFKGRTWPLSSLMELTINVINDCLKIQIKCEVRSLIVEINLVLGYHDIELMVCLDVW